MVQRFWFVQDLRRRQAPQDLPHEGPSRQGPSPLSSVRRKRGSIWSRKFFEVQSISLLGVSMKRTATRAQLGFLLFSFGFSGAILTVSAPAAVGQACSSKPLEQGRVCTKPGARCSPPTIGAGDVGVCTIEGLRPEALACECQGAPIPSYNVTLTPLTPSDLDTGVATS